MIIDKIEVVIWSLTILSIIGTIMNAKLNKWCFIVYIIANTGWIGINMYCGLWQQIPMWIVYIIIGIYGWYTWSKPKMKEQIVTN
jgi:nicotinamide riboside transporter PnuC